ncbi:hypothetical protein [Haladaptatus sp. W1]|uniref:hypothetical protein n=1 Tax=Haladaptatus sp. W1 TaxID=1897478 RepID=UPI00111300FA|nr:hypothetical protein [Haladaptatus sp. W1]
MVSRKTRLRYIPYGLIVIGLVAVWYGYFERLTVLLVGATAILGGGYTIARGYSATSLVLMFGGLALSGVLGFVYTLLSDGVTISAIAFLLLGIAAGIRARQYWQVRPWKPEDSGW